MVLEVLLINNKNMFADLIKYINFKNPLFQFSLFLLFFACISIADLLIPTSNPVERNGYIIKFIIFLATSDILYFSIRYGFRLTQSNPFNTFVSTFIVLLLIHPTNNIWYFPLAAIMIQVGKFIFRRNKQPIFNPAALAIVLTYTISVIVHMINPTIDTLLVSWWGADMFQNITKDIPFVNVIVPVVLLSFFFYYANSFKKANYIFSFFATYAVGIIFYSILTSSLNAGLTIISLAIFNSTAFAALVMIPEPKTSPSFPKQQIIAGIIVGLGLVIFSTGLSAIPIEPLINTVILADIVTLIIKMKQTKPKTPTPAPNPVQPTMPVQPIQPVNENIKNMA
jgi:hypothetical protein